MAKSAITQEVDARTNMPVERLDWEVNSDQEYKELRAAFAAMPKTPVLMNVKDAEQEHLQGRRYDWLVKSEQSGGTIALHRIILLPGFRATDHNHVSEGEFFYVLEGEVELTIGNKTVTGGPGTFGYAPPMATHAFSPVGDQPAALLHWNMPGGHERMADAMAKARLAGELTPEIKKSIYIAHEYLFHED